MKRRGGKNNREVRCPRAVDREVDRVDRGVTGRPPREATTRSISRYVSDGGVRSRDALQSSMRTDLRGRRGASPLPDRERKLHTSRGCAQIWGRSRTLTMPEPLSHTRAETSPSSAMACVCSGVRGGGARQRAARRARRFGVATRDAKARRALNGEKLIRRAAPETRRCGACVAQTVARTARDAPFVRSSRVSGSRGTCVARW